MLYNARYSLHACNDRHILKALVPLIPNLALLRVVLLNQSIKEKLELKTFLYTHITQFFHQIFLRAPAWETYWNGVIPFTLVPWQHILNSHYQITQITSGHLIPMPHFSSPHCKALSAQGGYRIILSPRPLLPTLADTLKQHTCNQHTSQMHTFEGNQEGSIHHQAWSMEQDYPVCHIEQFCTRRSKNTHQKHNMNYQVQF